MPQSTKHLVARSQNEKSKASHVMDQSIKGLLDKITTYMGKMG